MRIGSLLLSSLLAASWLAAGPVACGSPHTSTPDADTTPEAGPADAAAPVEASPADAGPDRYAAFVPPTPTVANSGGPVLATARVVPVFFPRDPNQATLSDFVTKYLASPEWKTSMAEYGVTGATVGPAVVAPALPQFMTSSDAFNDWLASQLDGTNPAWGPTDEATLASTLFLFFLPAGPLEAPQSTYTICQQASGWHWHTIPASPPSLDGGAPDANADGAAPEAGTSDGGGPLPRVPVLYAIVGECEPMYGVSTLDQATVTATHELAETFSDPYWDTSPANFTVAPPYGYWVAGTAGGEIGDMCQAMPSDTFTPADLGYSIQRIWSNEAALAGHDPCQPVAAGSPPYFNSVPDVPDTFTEPTLGVPVRGVIVKAGQSRTIDVRLFSDGPTADWTVQVLQSGYTAMIGLKLDRATGNNGDVLHLTISVDKGAAGLVGQAIPFGLASGDALDAPQSMWMDEVLITQ